MRRGALSTRDRVRDCGRGSIQKIRDSVPDQLSERLGPRPTLCGCAFGKVSGDITDFYSGTLESHT